jgi:hypothetical protein
MYSITQYDGLKTILREQVCARCASRLDADGAAAPTGPAPAADQGESECSLFANLPRLARLARDGEPPCGYQILDRSLTSLGGAARTPDISQAMAIIESLAGEHTQAETDCERLNRLNAAVECLVQVTAKP